MTTLHFIVSDKGSARAADRRAALRRLQLENPEISWKMHSLDELPDLKLDHSRQVSIVSVEQIQQAEELSKRLRSQGGVVGLDIDSLSSHKALREELADFFVTSNPEGKIARTLPDLFVLPQPYNDDENSGSIEEDLPLVTYPQNPSPDGVSDWLFVTPKASKGWILEAICREIGSRYRGTWEIVYNPKKLPKARNYFFAHYWNYMDQLRQNPHIREGRTFVWYTHPREIPFTEDEQLEGYRSATQVFFTCSEFLNNWIEKGLPKERGRVVLGGADRFLFQPHRRGQSRVGLSSSYYARKNPHVLLDLIRMMPHRHFHLVGREWDQFDRFNEMLALPNFTYETARYEDYPRIYAQFDVFLSMSILEGGPIPLLEAMMSNIIPVASRTGFAPDLIQHGQNGFIFDVDADAKTIAPLIDAAFDMTVDVRSTVIDYTWDNFSSEILAYGDTPHEFKPRVRKMIGR